MRAQSCGELEQLLKADARKKLDAGIDEQIKAIRDYGAYGYGYGRDVGGGFDGPVVGAPGSGGQGGGAAAGSGGAGGSGGTGTPPPSPTNGDGEGAGDDGGSPDYSDTNTQVKGVDEADFVEVDGTNVYLLHGTKFLTLGAQPSAPAVNQEISIDGSPREMFVTRDGGARRAVIYSDVNGADVYAKAGVEPKTSYVDYGYGVPVAVGGGGVDPRVIEVAQDEGGAPEFYAPLTKVTVLDLPEGGPPAVLSEVYFEGSYSTARRVGSIVRTVLNGGEHGPEVTYYPSFDPQNPPPAPQDVDAWVAVFEQLRAEGRAKIDASTSDDWLPYFFVKQGESVSAKNLACESYHVPGAGSTQYGLTQIQSFDIANPAQITGTAIVGHADVVYSNADSLYGRRPRVEPHAPSAPRLLPRQPLPLPWRHGRRGRQRRHRRRGRQRRHRRRGRRYGRLGRLGRRRGQRHGRRRRHRWPGRLRRHHGWHGRRHERLRDRRHQRHRHERVRNGWHQRLGDRRHGHGRRPDGRHGHRR